MQLPQAIQVIIDSYLKESNPHTPDESLFLAIISQVSQMLCFNNIKIVSKELDYDTSPNLYILNFMESGEGKDKPIKNVKDCITTFEEHRNRLCSLYMDNKKEEIKLHIEQSEMKSADAREYRKNNAPLFLRYEASDGTVEGFLKARETINDAGFGSLHFGNSEFVDYIDTNSEARKYMMTYLIETFDNGNFSPKIIKGDNFEEKRYSIPQTLFAHSSIEFLTENELANNTLNRFLQSGLARRALISYPKKIKVQKSTIESKKERVKNAMEGKEQTKYYFNAFLDKIAFYKKEYLYGLDPEIKLSGNKEITISPDLFDIIEEYKEDIKILSEKESITAVRLEMKNREWRTIKLAGCIAAFTSSGFEIQKKHWDEALSITEYFAEQFKRFFTQKINNSMNDEKVYDYIKNNQGCTKTELRRNAIQRKYRDNLQYFTNIIENTRQLCADNEEQLNIEEVANKTLYFIIPRQDD